MIPKCNEVASVDPSCYICRMKTFKTKFKLINDLNTCVPVA
jgi:hypothetical protein